MRRVVVGYDGSIPARVALEQGADEADLRRVPLVVLTAWSTPMVSSPYPIELDPGIFEDGARRSLDEAVGLARARHPDVEVDGELVQNDPRTALLSAVGSDDLLVVGTRGRGGVAGLLLGSVATHCIRHAACPVLVVRHVDAGSSTPEVPDVA